jgi:hypothetical protein
LKNPAASCRESPKCKDFLPILSSLANPAASSGECAHWHFEFFLHYTQFLNSSRTRMVSAKLVRYFVSSLTQSDFPEAGILTSANLHICM